VARLPDDPAVLKSLLVSQVKDKDEVVRALKGRLKEKDGRLKEKDMLREAEVREREAEVREREAEVRERDTRLVMATTALARGNTELLRYKRKCVPVCMCGWAGRPTVSPLDSPCPLRLPVHVRITTFPLQTS
jgi:hypothetical protein